MPEQFKALSQWISEVLGIGLQLQEKLAVTLIALLAYVVLRWGVGVVVRHGKQEITRQYIFLKTVKYLLGFALLIAFWRIWLGQQTGLAAYLGILSAGLAIALQDPLVNFAGWIFISVRKPFAVGDRVAIGDHAGDVIDLRLFQFTLLEIGNWVDADQSTGRIIHIPNGWVFKQTVSNFTQGFNIIWNEIPVTVTFESDWKKAKKLIQEIGERHTAVKTEQAKREIRQAAKKYLIFFEYLTPIVWTSVADIGVTLTLRYLCEPRKRRSSAGIIWEEILTAFAACDDVDFAYPTQRFYDNAREGKPGAGGPKNQVVN
jgi:small-conductance mechanosensitive channel